MLRMTPNNSSARAKTYYTLADYYLEDAQELAGEWRGKGAELLGLSGTVQKTEWDRLCDNEHPTTGEPLTLRQKSNRRVGYDFTFDVPKSYSLLYSLTEDERLLDSFRAAMRETMDELEAEIQTRVRKRGRNENRTTGNMLWGEFIHFTARPVDGIPDPNLHGHCFVINGTFDDQEQTWKAGEFSNLKRDAYYFQQKFDSRLASRMMDLGLAVERTKSSWQLAGLDKATLDKFSLRTAEIEAEAKRLGIVDPVAKAELGAKTRSRKVKDLTLPELREEWRSRLTDDEQTSLRAMQQRLGGEVVPRQEQVAQVAVDQAIEHVFERQSVVPERKLLAEAIKRSIGQASLAAVEQAFSQADVIVKDHRGRRMVTTPAVLGEEQRYLRFAREGRGTCPPLQAGPHQFRRTWLNQDQQKAAEHVLQSRDRVTLVRGAAGVGKTTMMKETIEAIEATGVRVFPFAPSSKTSGGVLREKEGFATADTVTRLLVDERLQQQLAGNVVWIDEAGQVSSREMAQIFDLAGRQRARIVLSGDIRQHGSVGRGSALRLLEQEAGLVPAEIKEILRQQGDYKRATAALSEGRVEEGFEQLNQLGWIREVRDRDRYRILAEDYVGTVLGGETALVVSPTHLEAERITNSVRERLKAAGRIAADERRVAVLHKYDLTDAERSDAVNFSPGDVLEFHQNAKGFQKGQRITLGTERPPIEQAARFQVFHPRTLSLAAGDVIRITRNGKSLEGVRFHNGDLLRIAGFDADGNLLTQERKTIAADFGHLAYGYVTTSYSSQGSDVDRIFIGQSTDSRPAASQQQFYVSISRGKKQATIYTKDKDELLASIQRSEEKLTATELVQEGGVSRQPSLAGLPQARPELPTEQAERQPKELIYER